MSDALAADIMAKIVTVPALAASAGLALGGRAIDPALTQVTLPAAWVLLSDDRPDVDAFHERSALVMQTQQIVICYVVMLYVPYVSQSDLINTQFPLLRAVRAAIHATDSPSGHRWRYEKQRLALVNPDRLAYEQRYTVRSVL